MAHPRTSFTTFMVVAAIAGFGGGNFASSMTNINAFYPQRLKGWALGLNAGGGNIGVAMIQIVGLLVIATAGNRSPHWVCAVYLVLLSIAAVGAALFMDNLTNQRTNGRSMIQVMAHRDSWLISLLYIGTFGSFIGYSFAFGQVLQTSFLANLSYGHPVTPAMTAQASLHAAQIAFVGPLLGSLSRPPGGWLSDRIGGGKVTLYTFVAMVAATGWLVTAGEIGDAKKAAPSGAILAAYVIGFVALFILSGIGNGSTYKMIPSIFDAKAQGMDALSPVEKADWSRRMAGALIGIAGAIGALGGVGINVVLRASYLSPAKSATMAFWVFLCCYVLCAVITWFAYVRRPTKARAPEPAAVEEAVATA
jgi:MFS transporter, NNP family, nitrate/nitrite transporter